MSKHIVAYATDFHSVTRFTNTTLKIKYQIQSDHILNTLNKHSKHSKIKE